MRGFIDLHCHWIASIDDGARSPLEGVTMLQNLHAVGFSTVVATPHMRPGMFENDAPALRVAYEGMAPHLEGVPNLPEVLLASEHFFDDVTFNRMKHGEVLPYPPGAGRVPAATRCILVEFPPQGFPVNIQARFYDMRRLRLSPILAHPERYAPVWSDDTCLDPLIDAGAGLLLDVCALVGKYGRRPQKSAEKLLEDQAYEAACSDAHRPEDAEVTGRAIARLQELVGPAELNTLLVKGPAGILEGRRRRGQLA